MYFLTYFALLGLVIFGLTTAGLLYVVDRVREHGSRADAPRDGGPDHPAPGGPMHSPSRS